MQTIQEAVEPYIKAREAMRAFNPSLFGGGLFLRIKFSSLEIPIRSFLKEYGIIIEVFPDGSNWECYAKTAEGRWLEGTQFGRTYEEAFIKALLSALDYLESILTTPAA